MIFAAFATTLKPSPIAVLDQTAILVVSMGDCMEVLELDTGETIKVLPDAATLDR